MNIIIAILAIASLIFILNILIVQSTNFIFLFLKKPVLWIFVMGALSFIYFFVGSIFNDSFEIIWWSALLAFVVNIPPKMKKKEKSKQKIVIDEMYTKRGIKNGELKYRLGLTAYLIGGIAGWIIFYAQVLNI